MTIYYSASKKGFFDDAIYPASELPKDIVEVSEDTLQALLVAQMQGQSIELDASGAPVPVPVPAQSLASVQAQLCASIDAMADAAYVTIGSPSPGRLAEYQQASNDAQAFKAAGYPAADVPPTVACWVTASGMTPEAAADNIISTASAWISVLQNIRAARLIGKKNVNTATNTTDAQAAANNAMAQIQSAQAQA